MLSRPCNDTPSLYFVEETELTRGINLKPSCMFVSLQAEDRSLHEKIIEIHEEYAALVVRSVVIFGCYSVPLEKPLIDLIQ